MSMETLFIEHKRGTATCPCCKHRMTRASFAAHHRATKIMPGGRKVCPFMEEHPGYQDAIDRREAKRTGFTKTIDRIPKAVRG